MTASMQPSAGTSSPAAKTLIFSRPPDIASIRAARRSAPTPTPGSPLGQEWTIRHSMVPLAMAGAASAAAAVAVPAKHGFRQKVASFHVSLPLFTHASPAAPRSAERIPADLEAALSQATAGPREGVD
jgi:hypothetical protein